jgi:hypothetical protein
MSDTLRRRLALLEVTRADEHGEAAGREIFRDLPIDSFVCPGHEGDELAVHGVDVAPPQRMHLAVLGAISPSRMPKPHRDGLAIDVVEIAAHLDEVAALDGGQQRVDVGRGERSIARDRSAVADLLQRGWV